MNFLLNFQTNSILRGPVLSQNSVEIVDLILPWSVPIGPLGCILWTHTLHPKSLINGISYRIFGWGFSFLDFLPIDFGFRYHTKTPPKRRIPRIAHETEKEWKAGARFPASRLAAVPQYSCIAQSCECGRMDHQRTTWALLGTMPTVGKIVGSLISSSR